MIHCVGLTCDRAVKEAGQFCSSCWPPEAPATLRQMRFNVLHWSYKLALGNEDEKVEAIEKLSFLINILQRENTNAR